MLFQGMLTIILFALVIYFFVRNWSTITGSANSELMERKLDEYQRKKDELHELEKTVDVQKEINRYEKEIDKLKKKLDKLREK